MIPVVFFVIVITFVLMHSAQGSPWDKAGGRQLSQVVIDNLNKKYGLDKPVWEQFLLYVWNVLHFDFGLSYQYQGKSVLELIGGGWPYTATIGVLAFAMIVPIGVGLGVLAALRQNSRIDYATMGFATFAASFPNFVVGALMIVFFSVLLYKWTSDDFFLPAGGTPRASRARAPWRRSGRTTYGPRGPRVYPSAWSSSATCSRTP